MPARKTAVRDAAAGRKPAEKRAAQDGPLAPHDLILQLSERFREHPVRRFLDFRLLELSEERCVMSIEFRPEFDNTTGAVHGGILAMLADTAVACVLAASFAGTMDFVTSNLNIHYLRRANTAVTAEATIIKKGSKVCVGQCQIYDEQRRLVALCTCDFVLLPERI